MAEGLESGGSVRMEVSPRCHIPASRICQPPSPRASAHNESTSAHLHALLHAVPCLLQKLIFGSQHLVIGGALWQAQRGIRLGQRQCRARACAGWMEGDVVELLDGRRPLNGRAPGAGRRTQLQAAAAALCGRRHQTRQPIEGRCSWPLTGLLVAATGPVASQEGWAAGREVGGRAPSGCRCPGTCAGLWFDCK